MSNPGYSPEFRNEAIRQIIEAGHSTSEVATCLGVSANSLYKWVKAVRPDTGSLKDEELIEAKRENLKLRAELRRTGSTARIPRLFLLRHRSIRAIEFRISSAEYFLPFGITLLHGHYRPLRQRSL
jgi:transposase